MNLFEPDNHLEDQLTSSDTFTTGPLSSCPNEPTTDNVISSTSSGLIESHYSSEKEVVWNSSCSTRNTSAEDDDPRMTALGNLNSTSLDCMQKRLLKLNLELIEDLELLEWESTAPSSTNFLGDKIDPTVRKLDVPIFRMLNHSTRLLEILESERPNFDAYTAIYPVTESMKTYSHNITQLPSKPVVEEIMDDGITTVSTHDSGYLTSTLSPPGTSQMLPPRPRLPVFLSILTTYCHLIRLYHAIFTQLYQMFLIVPPPEGSRFLLLPSSQYTQNGMDDTLIVQVQVLIEFSFNILTKLEHALEVQSEVFCGSDSPSSPHSSTLNNTSLSVIREQIVAHEGIVSGIPLKETMKCLDQLVKASAN